MDKQKEEGRLAAELDDVYSRTQAQIEALMADGALARDKRARAKAWLGAMRMPTLNVVWKKNRNQHARLLLAQLRAGVLQAPFDTLPPQNGLPTMQPWTMYRFMSPTRRGMSPTKSAASALAREEQEELDASYDPGAGFVEGISAAEAARQRIRHGIQASPERRGQLAMAPKMAEHEIKAGLSEAGGRADLADWRARATASQMGKQGRDLSAARQESEELMQQLAHSRAEHEQSQGAAKEAAKSRLDALIDKFEGRRAAWEEEGDTPGSAHPTEADAQASQRRAPAHSTAAAGPIESEARAAADVRTAREARTAAEARSALRGSSAPEARAAPEAGTAAEARSAADARTAARPSSKLIKLQDLGPETSPPRARSCSRSAVHTPTRSGSGGRDLAGAQAMPAPLPLYKSNPLGGSGVALKSPTPEYDKLKAYNWMNGLCGTDPSCRASHICASADAAARQQGKLVLPTAEEAALEAARTAKPHGACCDGCAHGTGCEGSAPAPLSSYMPPISASVADLTGPCGGLPYDDEAAAVYSCCAAQSPRPRALKLPTPEEAAAEVAAEGAGSARLGCESPRAALRAPMSGPASPRCGSLGLPVRPTCAHPCSPNYSPRGGYFNPKPTNRCDPDCTASPKRPVSPICRREFVDANVRDRPFSSTLPGSAYAPLCSPPKAPEPLMAPAAGRRYSSPPPARGCSAWPGSAALPSRPMSPSGYAARPYLRDLSPDYARPLSPVRPAMAPAYASNLLPTGPGLTDGRHLQALSPGRRTYCSPFYEPYNVRNTSPRASYLDHLARIEEETQRLRAELRGF